MSRIVWVDVFAPTPMSGNPLAVILEPEGLDAARMQMLAAELGLSETVFVFPPESPEAAARLRIFTPSRELPMAGSPIVGAAWVIHTAGDMSSDGVVETGVGPLSVRVSGQVATMVQAPPEAGPVVDTDEVAAACGVVVAPGQDAQVWSTGLPQLMLPVASVDSLEAARPDHQEITRLSERDGWIGVSLYSLSGGDGPRIRVRVRHFAPAAARVLPRDHRMA